MKSISRIASFIFFVLMGVSVFSQKDDTLYFLNGDKITCEIRTFQYGYFTVKTSAMSTIDVKYDKIATMYSGKTFEIVLDNNARVFGSIDTSFISNTVNIIVLNSRNLTYLSSIVEITPIKNKFWRRFSGDISIGYNYTQSTKISQGDFNGMLEYRPRNFNVKLSSSALFSTESGRQVSKKDNINLTTLRYLKHRWFILSSAGAQQNYELGLDLRLQGVLGYGKDLIHTKSNQLMASLGLSVNQERSSDSTENTVNSEGVIYVYYKLFLISIPKINITTQFVTYPSFTVKDRWRISYYIKVGSEIITNLTLNISLDYSFDSKPPSASSSTSDINISTSIGYSFY